MSFGWINMFMNFGWINWINMAAVVWLVLIYGLLRMKKASSGIFVLYGLAIIPVLLFLMNGILLRHLALVIASLVFGISHFIIARENV